MRVAIIGRSEVMFETAEQVLAAGHQIPLIITAKEAPEYTKTSSDFQQQALRIGAQFIHTASILTAIDAMRGLPPIDVAVSVNYSGVIPQEVIDCFSLGILNAHGGDLPRYRGNACQAWAMLNNEEKIGLCIHRMIGGELDNGDIIARMYFPIDLNTKIREVWSWIKQQTPILFLDAIEKLSINPQYVLEQQSKDPLDALRCYPRRPEDGRIDWSRPAEDVVRLVNASGAPYAGAFCYLQGVLVRVLDASVLEDGEQFMAIPGQITYRSEKIVDVACGQGKIRVNDIALEDGYKGSAAHIITSLRQRFN